MIEKLDEDKAEILNLKSGRLETIHFNFDGFAEYQYQNIFAHLEEARAILGDI